MINPQGTADSIRMQQLIMVRKLAKEYLDVKEYDLALKQYDQLLDLQPQKDDEKEDIFYYVALLSIGKIFLYDKKYNEALSYFNRILQEYPNNIARKKQVLPAIAKAYQGLNDFQNALDYFNASLTFEPNVMFMKEKINCLISLKNYQQALAYLDSIIPSFPRDARLWHQKAELFLALQQIDNAKIALEQILSIEPTHLTALFWLSNIYAKKQEYSVALEYLTKALQTNKSLYQDPKELISYKADYVKGLFYQIYELSKKKSYDPQADIYHQQILDFLASEPSTPTWDSVKIQLSFCKGERLLQQQQYEEALKFFDDALEGYNKQSDEHKNEIQRCQKQIQLTRDKLSESRKLDTLSDNFEQTLNIGQSFTTLGLKGVVAKEPVSNCNNDDDNNDSNNIQQKI